MCSLGKNFYSSGCVFDSNRKSVSKNTKLIVCGAHICENRVFYKVIYKEEEYFIDAGNVSFADENVRYYNEILNLTEQGRETFYNAAKEYSVIYHQQMRQKALDFLNSCEAKGITVLDWDMIDESEYTESIGLKIRMYNPTNKIIKHIWMNVTGYNSVGDKVIDPVKKTSNMEISGVGPLDPDASGVYDVKFVWFTDLVSRATITSIKVEYMDGTIKTVSSPATTIMDKELYRYLME